jgi:hypothetical protein
MYVDDCIVTRCGSIGVCMLWDDPFVKSNIHESNNFVKLFKLKLELALQNKKLVHVT